MEGEKVKGKKVVVAHSHYKDGFTSILSSPTFHIRLSRRPSWREERATAPTHKLFHDHINEVSFHWCLWYMILKNEFISSSQAQGFEWTSCYRMGTRCRESMLSLKTLNLIMMNYAEKVNGWLWANSKHRLNTHFLVHQSVIHDWNMKLFSSSTSCSVNISLSAQEGLMCKSHASRRLLPLMSCLLRLLKWIPDWKGVQIRARSMNTVFVKCCAIFTDIRSSNFTKANLCVNFDKCRWLSVGYICNFARTIHRWT